MSTVTEKILFSNFYRPVCNDLQKTTFPGTVSGLFSRSLWLVFGAFVCISLGSTLYAGYLFIKTTAENSTMALAENLTSRLEATYNLLEGMSNQPLIQDTGISVLDRAMSMKPTPMPSSSG